ncbi:MAG: tRNA lysidine(34) synthetase TilS [Clostridia bacterium]|nr:tRNA lysidine(34) synthetase TilS [Clostridia bacterium]
MLSSVEGERAYKKIIDTMSAHGMDRMLDGGVLVGLSGGADSVFLLCALYEYRRRCGADFSIVAVHVNHLIRGEEAERDERFSSELAATLGLECICTECDAPAMARERSVGMEEAAREVRYAAFREILQGRKDVRCVALAHNSTDNLETVIINMMRGCGIGGMCGIPPVRGEYIRPLMAISSDDIRSLLDAYGIRYIVDSSNLSDDYTRNFIRHNVTPALRHIASDPERMAERMCENMRDAYSLVSSLADDIVESIPDPSRFCAKSLRGLAPSVFAAVITRIVKTGCGTVPSEKHIRAIGEAIDRDDFSVSVCGEYDFVAERGICFFREKSKTARIGEFFDLKEGKNNIEGYALDVFVGEDPDKSSLNIYKFSIEHSFCFDIINDGLYIRFRSEGDSYRYGSHTRKLKKVFNDRGIPPFMRDNIPMLCDKHGILWVPGLPARDGCTGSGVKVTFCFRNRTPSEREVFVASDMIKIEQQKGLDNT